MRSRRLTVCFAALALTMLLPLAAHGQTSRVEGMALQPDYIKDYVNIYTYLSSVTQVGNLVYGELGNTGGAFFSPPRDRSVGAVLGNLWDGHLGTWAIHIRQQRPQMGSGSASQNPAPVDSIGSADPNVNFNEAFDLMWGKKFGTMSLGLRFNRSFVKDEVTLGGVTTSFEFQPLTPGGAANENLGRNVTGLGGGVGFEMSPNLNLEVALNYESRTFENTATTSQDDGSTNYMLAGRGFWQWTPNVVVTPVLKFYSMDLSRKTTAPAASFDNTMKGWQIGAAGNWTLGSNDLFVLGATFAQNRLKQQEDIFGLVARFPGMDPSAKATETMMPQIFAALETHINRWLTLRFGANKGAFEHVKIENQAGPARTQEVSLSSFHMNLGVGAKISTLQLDAILSDTFPQTLGWLGSGVPGTYFPKVTATYSF